MELCQKIVLRDWTHVQEAILLTGRFMEACARKSNGRFSAVIGGRLLKGEEGDSQKGRGVLSRDSTHEETMLLISI